MHIVPVCCIDLLVASLSIGTGARVPDYKPAVKHRPHFTVLHGKEYLVLAVILSGNLFSPSWIILQLVLSVFPTLYRAVVWMDQH